MKTFLAATLCPLAGIAASVVILGLPIHVRAVSTATPSGNGDVNGDGLIDVSDAVYTLLYLFKGGEPPVACADSPELVRRVEGLEAADAGVAEALADVAVALREFRASPCRERCGLPATGQTRCYDQTGAEIPCDSATCPGQDGRYATGCPTGGRFVDNGDGTVSDTCTGLMWQKDTADVNGDGQNDGADTLQWCDALAYCENLSFGGGVAAWDDWRLPNVRELHSIVDYGRGNPSIDPVFGAVWSDYYWSSTSFADRSRYAWIVNASDSLVNFDSKDDIAHVRAVRTAP